MTDAREPRSRVVTVLLWLGALAGAGFALSAAPWFQPRRAPTELRPSSWKGEMVFLGTGYAFELVIEEVDDDGDFQGTLSWPDHFGRSRIRGTADGDHLVFIDADHDEKDVRLAGVEMRGTDKGGRATFVARRVDAGPAPPPAQPVLDPAWARQAAVCEGLSASGWSRSQGAACWRALAVAAKDVAACARLQAQVDDCAKDVAGAKGDVAGCRGDVECVVMASLHGAGEAACETLGEAGQLARCLAGVRRSAAPCEGLDAKSATRCVDHFARVTNDADACERLVPAGGDFGRSQRERCLQAVGIATRSRSVCERLEADPRRSTMGALARTTCLEALAPEGASQCRRRSTPNQRSACLLKLVGDSGPGGGEQACAEVSDEAMRAACVRAAKLPAAPPLHF